MKTKMVKESLENIDEAKSVDVFHVYKKDLENILTDSMERFDLSRNVAGLMLAKATEKLARYGVDF